MTSPALRDALAALEPFAELDKHLPEKGLSISADGYNNISWHIPRGAFRNAAKAYEALRASSSDVSVPREPTEAMIEAGYRMVGHFQYSPAADKGWGEKAVAIYKAMLSASPQAKGET